MRTTRTRLAVTALAAVTAAALVAGAGAFWSTSGLGSGSATAGSPAPVELSPAAPTTALYPGRSGDVAVVVDNPNPHQVFVGALALDPGEGDGGFTVDGAHGGCEVDALSFTTQTNGGDGWFVPASTSATLELTDAVAMSTSAASDCQGATFTVHLKAGT